MTRFFTTLAIFFLAYLPVAIASEGEVPVERDYVAAPAAPQVQTWEEADRKSAGCVSCHTETDRKTMHTNPAVVLGCTDCHGGDAAIHWREELPHRLGAASAGHGDSHAEADADDHGAAKDEGHEEEAARWPEPFQHVMDEAHILPRYPHTWHYPSSANPEHAYTLLNKESAEFVRFVNPGDYRSARLACGNCHDATLKAAERSLMSTGAMLYGGGSYNNGILPFKRYILGESYTPDGTAKAVDSPAPLTDEMIARGNLARLYPLPTWQTTPPADVFRVFEAGGRNLGNLFPETGLPNAIGQIQRLEEPGRTDFKQSNRGPGTGGRIAIPVLNIHKTRLNDPNMWFMGTNDNPGDYRHSGCSGCHVVYANDRDPRHSGKYADFGHEGMSQTVDPMIPNDESGHPLEHAFTRAVPTSQCMNCHMHQPNMFMNTYLGYTMWDYESDAPAMWPEEQHYPDAAEMREVLDRNPEEAVIRGKWRDVEFMKQVSEMNPELNDTQFADYHGHGWNFRAIFKRDRDGTLLDAEGEAVSDDDKDKFKKAVHMSSIHVDAGMHCADCHFAQDSHGNGYIQGEVMAGVEIQCMDCHGTADAYPTLITSGPAAPPDGNDIGLIRNPDGKKRFEWIDGTLLQRSLVNPGLEWEVSLVKDSVNPEHPDYNEKAAHAKLVSKNDINEFTPDVPADQRAHKDDEMLCYSCHTSWTTSCGGCHLAIQANWKTESHHYEGSTSRNFATYNPQVVRDQMFQLGKHGEIKGGMIAPVRSSSALVLSSMNANRERIYVQQPPIAASGYSSQAFAPHFPHTARKTETKTCDDCHLSEEGDNNAIMAQLLLLGTNFVNFVGANAWVGGEDAITAVRVTEYDEPQAVIGSYLHRYAYPDWFNDHQEADKVLQTAYDHGSGPVGCLQLRGEYLFASEGKKGTQAYDVASIANKAISQRIISGPFSPLGHNTRIKSKNATCVALPTEQPIHPDRNKGDLMRITNMEQPFHPIYDYALISDAEEGLILTDVNTLADGEFRNNFLERAITWDAGGRLKDVSFIKIAGYWVYAVTPSEVLVLNLDNPLDPQLAASIPIRDARGLEVQFRYLFVTSGKGLEIVDVTHPDKPRIVEGAVVELRDAQRIYVARTYAYVAAGSQGLAIIDVKKPEQPFLEQLFNGGGAISDARDVIVGSTNASLFAYVADGANGLKVVQLTSPDLQPKFYGFSPKPNPDLIASYPSDKPMLSLSKGLARDRAVDETGGQMAIFGRIGSRPFTLEEMQKLYLDENGEPWFVPTAKSKRAAAKASSAETSPRP